MRYYCRHQECIDHALEELMHLAAATIYPKKCVAILKMIDQINRSGSAEVRCRHVPRPANGLPQAPLP